MSAPATSSSKPQVLYNTESAVCHAAIVRFVQNVLPSLVRRYAEYVLRDRARMHDGASDAPSCEANLMRINAREMCLLHENPEAVRVSVRVSNFERCENARLFGSIARRRVAARIPSVYAAFEFDRAEVDHVMIDGHITREHICAPRSSSASPLTVVVAFPLRRFTPYASFDACVRDTRATAKHVDEWLCARMPTQSSALAYVRAHMVQLAQYRHDFLASSAAEVEEDEDDDDDDVAVAVDGEIDTSRCVATKRDQQLRRVDGGEGGADDADDADLPRASLFECLITAPDIVSHTQLRVLCRAEKLYPEFVNGYEQAVAGACARAAVLDTSNATTPTTTTTTYELLLVYATMQHVSAETFARFDAALEDTLRAEYDVKANAQPAVSLGAAGERAARASALNKALEMYRARGYVCGFVTLAQRARTMYILDAYLCDDMQSKTYVVERVRDTLLTRCRDDADALDAVVVLAPVGMRHDASARVYDALFSASHGFTPRVSTDASGVFARASV
jgi:hypothetical protein